MARWTDEDLLAIEYALETGVLATPTDTIIDVDSIPEWHEVFEPMAFPARLEYWGSTRLGDIQLRFIIPSKWSSMIEALQTATRRNLIVNLREFEG